METLLWTCWLLASAMVMIGFLTKPRLHPLEAMGVRLPSTPFFLRGLPQRRWFRVARAIWLTLTTVLVLRLWVFMLVFIPSSSMAPTLLIGDVVWVWSTSYNVRLPGIHTPLFSTGTPQRGDIVVFWSPRDTTTPFIKRVIGIPGDEVLVWESHVWVNGQPLRVTLPPTLWQDTRAGEETLGAATYTERLDTTFFSVFQIDPLQAAPPVRRWIIPQDTVFVMGDHRDRSEDSRIWGPVPFSALLGRAAHVVFNKQDGPARTWIKLQRLKAPTLEREVPQDMEQTPLSNAGARM